MLGTESLSAASDAVVTELKMGLGISQCEGVQLPRGAVQSFRFDPLFSFSLVLIGVGPEICQSALVAVVVLAAYPETTGSPVRCAFVAPSPCSFTCQSCRELAPDISDSLVCRGHKEPDEW